MEGNDVASDKTGSRVSSHSIKMQKERNKREFPFLLRDSWKGFGDIAMAHKIHIKSTVTVAFLIAFHVYLLLAAIHNVQNAALLIVLTSLVWLVVIYQKILNPHLGSRFSEKVIDPAYKFFDKLWNIFLVRLAFYLSLLGALGCFLIVDTAGDRQRLTGLGGVVVFYVTLFLLSNNKIKINWRPVCWGFGLHFILGLLVLRWDSGKRAFLRFSTLIVTILDFSKKGTSFVYGFVATPPDICGMSPVFAFSVLQVLIFFSALVSFLYYLGIMQFVIKKMAWFMQVTLSTTAGESVNACGCTFLGMTEAPLMIAPYVEKMTFSEIFACLSSGFSCIAGSLFASYISFGACPQFLLSSSIMAAPGSLACAKMLFPETEESQFTDVEKLELSHESGSSPLEAISNGAIAAIQIVACIVANLIVFLALLGMIDSIIGYLGNLVGASNLSVELIVGYLLFPLAYVMGVTESPKETLKVAQLMGTKTILNEFVAYQKLGELISADQISPRSAMIATYALCGFSNISCIGMQMALFGNMAPSKKTEIAKIVVRALICGCISCFYTATVAGIIVSNPTFCPATNRSTCLDINEVRLFMNQNVT